MENINEMDINARIMALITQRNRALDESVVLMAKIALLEYEKKDLEQGNKNLKEALSKIESKCPTCLCQCIPVKTETV